MAIERVGSEGLEPSIRNDSAILTVESEPTREDQIRNAADIIIRDEEILIDAEIDAEPDPEEELSFDSNLADVIDSSILLSISRDILASIEADKTSRSEWEDTYKDGLKYLGMKFDEARSTRLREVLA